VIELRPASYVERLDPHELFERRRPLHVDLGCGDGSFLCALAARIPERNFLGIERLAGRVRTASRKAASLENVRILRVESEYAVRYLLPQASVESFYLLFPDPWPKRRHHRRRVFTNEFLSAVSEALVQNGAIRVATDHADYFQQILHHAQASTDLEIHDFPGDQLPLSTFEKRMRIANVPIYRLELRKVSPVR
jgi:tRNA (guanine-N7-)-methyltransferase